MAKLKNKVNIGVKEISKLEVRGDKSELSNSFKTVDETIHHNCNGPHVPLVVVDEIDTVSGEGLKAFKEISGMLDSKGSKKALRVGISTRKSRYGLMNQQIESAEAQDREIRRWTAFEFSERCDDERSGRRATVGYYIQEDMDVISEDVWSKKEPAKQKEYTQHVFPGEKCLKCTIAAICLGDAKKQTSTSPMLKPLSEIIKKTRAEGADWALAQLMNLKPSVEGIIYREFEERVHVKTWNQMWNLLTGKEYPGECDHDTFVRKCFSDDTEVLTRNGFKLFKDLTAYDEVATLDDDGRLIYELPTDHIEYHYNGDMYNLYNQIGGHGKQLNLLMTEGHNQVYVDRHDLRRGRVTYKKKQIEELVDKREFYVPAAPLQADFGSGFSPISFMTPEQYAAFMGLWLSEGSCTSIHCNSIYRRNGVSVSQLKRGNIPRVDALMNSINWPNKVNRSVDKRDSGIVWRVFNKELYQHVSRWRYAVNKSISREFFDRASKRQMELMLEWLMLGDGSEYAENGRQQPYYGTGSEKLANDVQELAFRLGYRTNSTSKYSRPHRQHKSGTEYLKMHRVHVHSKGQNAAKKYWYINNNTSTSEFSGTVSSNIEKTQYDGMVYCVTMPSGRLFVRRNGVIALSGNCHEMKLPCYAGVDWGWSNPSTVVYFFLDKRDNVYVVRADGMTYYSDPAWIHYVKMKYHSTYRCQLYFPDQANQGSVEEMKKAGLPTANNKNKGEVNAGVQLIKKQLRTPGSQEPKLFVVKETCQPLIEEFSLYHFKTNAAGLITEEPESANDHWLDALRYALSNLLGSATLITSDAGVTDNRNMILDNRGNYRKAPSAAEFASVKGLRFNEDVNTSKLGKVGKQSELENDEEDGIGGDGGFLWSF